MNMIEGISVLSRKFYKIPFLIPYWDAAELNAIKTCLFKNRLVDGENTAEFERTAAKKFGFKNASGTSMGRAAIQLALERMRMFEGDRKSERDERKEVLVPSYGCTGIIQPIIQSGLTPVFIDVEKDFNTSANAIRAAVTKNTRAAIIPSLGGKPVDWDSVQCVCREHDLFVVDDAAQAVGVKYRGRFLGSFGDAGVFSFTLGKVLSATAGGLLTSKSGTEGLELPLERRRTVLRRALEVTLRGKYRAYTLPFFAFKDAVRRKLIDKPSYEFRKERLSNLDASIALIQLRKLDKIISLRRRNARILLDELASLDGTTVTLPERDENNAFTKFTIILNLKSQQERLPARPRVVHDFVKRMASRGVETELSYVPLHYRRPYDAFKANNLKNTESLWWKALNLPVRPGLSEEEMKLVAKAVKNCVHETMI